MKNYLMIHTHRHGTSQYFFRCQHDYTGWHNEENVEEGEFDKLFNALGADVEFEREEFVDIVEMPEKFVKV